MGGSPVLRLVGVGKHYRRVPVLRDVALVIEPGEVVAVSGRNGCGKSTLLRLSAGLTRPSYGEVHRPRRTGVVPDRFSPPERMSGRVYLRHHARMRGLDTSTAGRRADDLADRLGVLPGLDADLTSLSQGNARKVQLAQAFLAPVHLLLLDEAVGVLDEQGATAVDDLVEEAAAQGAAVLRTDPDLVVTRADRRLTLADGALEHQRSVT